MDISKNLKEIRKVNNLSQDEVANILLITKEDYIKIESGNNDISLNQLEMLANFYGLTVQELLYGKQNLEKFKDMYLYVLSIFKNGIPKTKLAKLLYLADFRHFYENLEPMSGVNYRCKTFGPLAYAFLSLTEEMVEKGQIKMEYSSNNEDIIISSKTNKPSLSSLTEMEKEEIKEVCELWKDIPTQEIVNYTHSQKPWMSCKDNEIIPYFLILQEEPDHVYQPIS